LITLLTVYKTGAQLCQGSLGDPIVNVTFGSGSNPGPALAAATTSYQYISGDCPNDGFYTVRNNTANCFGNTWHSLNSDHTGNGNGYFMLVNASIQPSAFYLDTVRVLCGGTTYEFAAWIVNVLKPTSCNNAGIQPNLTFTIEQTDGTVLQTYNTNNISAATTPVWQQFGFFFTTPMNISDVVLRIFNNSQGGCGNDLALDDITFRPCGPQITSSITGSNTDKVAICQGDARSFTFSSTVSQGFNNPTFQWQKSNDGINWTDIPGAITTSLTQDYSPGLQTGNYSFRMAAAEAGNLGSVQCRVVSKPLTIQIAERPVITTITNSPVCQNTILNLTASGGNSYQWTGVNNFVASGETVSISNVQPNQAGKYYVQVTNDAGCKKLDSINVVVNPSPVATISPEASICEGEDVQLVAGGGTGYQWTPGTALSSDVIADPVASPDTTVQYSVIVSNNFSCKDTASVIVNVVKKPEANAGPDRWIIKSTSTQLSATASGQNISYSWTPTIYIDNPQSLQPVINPPRDTVYILTVVSDDGCGMATDAVQVFVYDDVFVPTAFSPNGDGLNDTWNIPALNAYPDFELSVFNRNGQIVFQSKKMNTPWNGKYKGEPLPVGVYVYMIDLKAGGGILKGTVTLLR
jgi:gliding motility-associated-like protein